MNKKLKKAFALILGFAFIFNTGMVFAEEEAVITDTTSDTTEEIIIEEENSLTELEGMEDEEFTEAPSGFGLFWKGLKENMNLALTFDPVKKAEKRLRYAEERMRIAEIMAESENPDIQARAEKMIETANKFMEKIEANKDKWLEKTGEAKERLIRNVARHQVNRELIMDELEEKISPEELDEFQAKRVKGLETGERLLNAINNENIPEEVKAQLEVIKDRIETHAEEVEQFREEHMELLQNAKAGDEEAKTQLGELQQERKIQLEQNRMKFKNELKQIKGKNNDN